MSTHFICELHEKFGGVGKAGGLTMLSIGYFGDGPWAHEAFRKLNEDTNITIKFVSVRHDKKDPVLLKLARENNIPIEISQNINAEEFIQK